MKKMPLSYAPCKAFARCVYLVTGVSHSILVVILERRIKRTITESYEFGNLRCVFAIILSISIKYSSYLIHHCARKVKQD